MSGVLMRLARHDCQPPTIARRDRKNNYRWECGTCGARWEWRPAWFDRYWRCVDRIPTWEQVATDDDQEAAR